MARSLEYHDKRIAQSYLTGLEKHTMTMNSPWCWIATGRQQTFNLTWTDPKSCSSKVPPNIIQPYTKSKKTLSSSRPVQHAKWPTSWWHFILLVVGEYRSLDRLLRILLQLGIIKPLYRTTKHPVKQSLLRNFILPASSITKKHHLPMWSQVKLYNFESSSPSRN